MIDIAMFTADLNKWVGSVSNVGGATGLSSAEILDKFKIAKDVAVYMRNAMGVWTQIQSGTEGKA